MKSLLLFSMMVMSLVGEAVVSVYNYDTYKNDSGDETFYVWDSYGVCGVSGIEPCTGYALPSVLVVPSVVGASSRRISEIGFRPEFDAFKLFVLDSNVSEIVIDPGINKINDSAFMYCRSIKKITIPATVSYIGDSAFCGCVSLTNITFLGDMPTLDANAFVGAPRSMTISVGSDSLGWDYYKKHDLLTPWEDRTVIRPGCSVDGDEPVTSLVGLVTTNVVIHYLTTNVPVNVVCPVSRDTCIVNVMTEIEGGNIAIPDTWAKNYSDYTKRFGSDFSGSLTKYTGKYDSANNPMFVWQDYVAGTDPTDVYDVFTATITMVDDKPQVQWSPVLTEKEAAKRTYTIYGKKTLTGTEDWEVVPSGEEVNYNFFKVSVKMK